MNDENLSTLDFSKKSIQKRILEKSEYLNLPDIEFFLLCEQQYRVNKGVYNTIDKWFYHDGIVNIIHRRIYLLAFLEFVTEENSKDDHHKYIRFGNGGLTKKLNQFMKETETEKYMI
jgi:riboflavin kinase